MKMIYCLIDDSRSCLKVGFSKNESTLRKRIQSLQTSNPFKIKVHAVKDGDFVEESRIHDLLRDHKTTGGSEWFSLNDKTEFIINKEFGISEKQTYEDAYSALFECSFSELEGMLGCEDIPVLEHWASDRKLYGTGTKNPTYLNKLFGQCFRAINRETLYEQILTHIGDTEEEGNEIPFIKLISMELFEQQISDEGFLLNSSCFQGIENPDHIIVCLEADLHEMELAEEIYGMFFWLLDAAYIELSVVILTKDRQTHLVPYEFIFNQ